MTYGGEVAGSIVLEPRPTRASDRPLKKEKEKGKNGSRPCSRLPPSTMHRTQVRWRLAFEVCHRDVGHEGLDRLILHKVCQA